MIVYNSKTHYLNSFYDEVHKIIALTSDIKNLKADVKKRLLMGV